MRSTIPATLVLPLLMSFPPAAAAGPLRMEFGDGYVTISASDVPLGQVLTEWARLGQTRIVNAEKLGGASLTLELSRVPEKQALEIVLRSVPGYLVAQRTTAAPGLSQFDRIVVMPGTVAPPARTFAPPPPPPPVQQPPPMPAMAVEDQDEPVQNTPDQGETAEQEQPQHPVPLTLPQPGVQPMPPPPRGQNEQGGVQQPNGPVEVPGSGAVVSPTPGQLPVPPPKPQNQPDQ